MIRGPKPRSKVVAINVTKRRSDINHDEPMLPLAGVDGGVPTAPRDMLAEGRAEWKRVAPILSDRGVLTIGDTSMLQAYCNAWARWKAANNILRRAAAEAAAVRARREALESIELAEAGGQTFTEAERLLASKRRPTAAQIAEAESEGRGFLYPNTHGNLAPNPIIAVISTAEKNLLQMASELGLTPTSRARIKAERPVGEINPFAEFSNARK